MPGRHLAAGRMRRLTRDARHTTTGPDSSPPDGRCDVATNQLAGDVMNLSDFHWSDVITKVVAAIIIVVITALIAKLLKKVLTVQLGEVKALQRTTDGGDGTLAESLGSIAALIVWMFGLIAVLNLFALTQVVTPIQGMLNGILGAMPNILGAGIVLFIGFVLAKIARELVVTALHAANADRFLQRIGERTSE